MSLAEIVAATRSNVGLFVMEERALLEVRGDDRVRWLDGMISGDVQALVAGDEGSGCYATLLTNRGAIVADLHVGRLGDCFVLESRRDQLPKILETLGRYIIADDVTLHGLGEDLEALGLEGPRAAQVLSATVGSEVALAAEDWAALEIAGRRAWVGAFGFSGETGFQIHVAREDRPTVEAAFDAAGRAYDLVRGDATALEVMRIEAGLPALCSELDEDVFPAEARLERAISTSKGCYVGQEIVARLRARGQVNHLLVGLRIEGAALPEVHATLSTKERRTGEITSTAVSPVYGPIALGYVRREHAAVGTRVEFEGGAARIAALPFGSLPGAGEPT